MPPPDVDEKLLLAGLETSWDSADRLAVPHLHIPKTRADDYGPPSPCYSYTSSASSATRSPSASEWRLKPLPPVPGIKWWAKLSQSRVPYELYASAASTPAYDASSYNSCIFDIETNHTSTSHSALWCSTSAYHATSSHAD
ncbi:hypothetical protein AbraIFM66950_010923, partial [Aspergillus brasiliensis]